MNKKESIGIVLGSALEPKKLIKLAKIAEKNNFDEIWLAEDFFFTGGISGASIVLANTKNITVGLGIVSAVFRHPALLAMEISTISAVYPNRFYAGIGLGVPTWIRQVGLHPKSPLSAMRTCVTSVRKLLEGKTINETSEAFVFDNVCLEYPEIQTKTPLHMGVIGPKMLKLSGEISDGTIFSVAASHEYVKWAQNLIVEGTNKSTLLLNKHRLTLYAIYSVDDDSSKARNAVRAPLAFYKSIGTNTLTDVYGNSSELKKLIELGGYEAVRDNMPDKWIEDLTISGSPREVSEKIKSYFDIGIDSVALFPMPSENAHKMISITAEKVLPFLD